MKDVPSKSIIAPSILTGHCLCTAVRYTCGPLLYAPTLCHCESCRRASGAHAVGWFTVKSAELQFLGSSPREFVSSPGVRRTFCGQCGTSLTYQSAERPGEVDLTLGSLDDPELAAPVDHIWMQDAPPWDRPKDGLPQFASRRDD